MMSRNILIFANDFSTVYNFRKELITELIKEYCVYISLPSDERNKYFERLGCVIVKSKINRHGINPLRELVLFKEYFLTINKINPEIVLTYTIKPNIYGGIVCRIRKIPYIANVTGLGSMLQKKSLKRTFLNLLMGLGLRKANHVFFQNEKNLEYCIKRKIVNTKYSILPGSGVNVNEYMYCSYPQSNVISFVTVSRIRRDKGYFELLEAISKIKEKYNNIEFHIVGWIEEELFKDKIYELQSKNKLIFHGKVSQDEVKAILKQSHCIIHPSYHEGMSNVLLEAASIGRPILASNIPGCKETFDQGITGFGFIPKLSSEIITSINKFMKLTHNEKEKMGKLGREKIVNEFDRKKIIDRYMIEINKIIEENNNGPISKNSQ